MHEPTGRSSKSLTGMVSNANRSLNIRSSQHDKPKVQPTNGVKPVSDGHSTVRSNAHPRLVNVHIGLPRFDLAMSASANAADIQAAGHVLSRRTRRSQGASVEIRQSDSTDELNDRRQAKREDEAETTLLGEAIRESSTH